VKLEVVSAKSHHVNARPHYRHRLHDFHDQPDSIAGDLEIVRAFSDSDQIANGQRFILLRRCNSHQGLFGKKTRPCDTPSRPE